MDDALAERQMWEMPPDARLVGWQCGFEPLFVAVWSYLPGVRLTAADAEEIAIDLLQSKRWFTNNNDPPGPDFIL